MLVLSKANELSQLKIQYDAKAIRKKDYKARVAQILHAPYQVHASGVDVDTEIRILQSLLHLKVITKNELRTQEQMLQYLSRQDSFTQTSVQSKGAQGNSTFLEPVVDVAPRVKKPIYKRVWFWIVVGFIALVVLAAVFGDDAQNSDDSATSSTTVKSEQTDEENALSAITKVIKDKALAADFESACKSIDIDLSKISDLKKIEDWASGTRYSFYYENAPLTAYCIADKVDSINLNSELRVYQSGYEPYSINDYIVDIDKAESLIPLSEDLVKTQLNYPATADFPLLDWSYGRDRSLYYLSSTVTGQNAFGVEEELPFTIAWNDNGDTTSVVYFLLDGTIIKDDRNEYTRPERKKISADTSSEDDGSISLVDGEKGKYGEADVIDGVEYIDYYVPAGKYQVVNDGETVSVFIVSGKDDVSKTLDFTKNGEEKNMTIKDGQHIELTTNGRITLIPIN
jgi:hypothetical protein